jgi:hypothetical protein
MTHPSIEAPRHAPPLFAYNTALGMLVAFDPSGKPFMAIPVQKIVETGAWSAPGGVEGLDEDLRRCLPRLDPPQLDLSGNTKAARRAAQLARAADRAIRR